MVPMGYEREFDRFEYLSPSSAPTADRRSFFIGAALIGSSSEHKSAVIQPSLSVTVTPNCTSKMKVSAVALLDLVVSCSGAASSSNTNPSKGFPSVSFAPRGGAAAAASSAAAGVAKKPSAAAAKAAAAVAASKHQQAAAPAPKGSSTAPLSQAAELTPEDEPLLRDISMLSNMLEEVVKKDDPEADALYRKFRSLGFDR